MSDIRSTFSEAEVPKRNPAVGHVGKKNRHAPLQIPRQRGGFDTQRARHDVSYVITNYEAVSGYFGHWLHRAQCQLLWRDKRRAPNEPSPPKVVLLPHNHPRFHRMP